MSEIVTQSRQVVPFEWMLSGRYLRARRREGFIGVVGTLTGVIVGLLICLNIESIEQFLSWLTNTGLFPPELYFLSKLPAEINLGETVAVVIMALTLSFLATLYPSWRAARLDPVEALRYG